MARHGLIAILIVLGSTPGAAQLCRGLASFTERPIQVFGAGTFNSNAKSFSAGVGYGGAGGFGRVGLGTTRINAWNGSSFDLGGSAGYEFRLNEKGSAQMCPVGGVGFVFGPNNILGSGFDYSETDLEVGLAFGLLAAQTAHLDIDPSASISYEKAAGDLKDTSGYSFTTDRSYGVLALAVGLVMNRQLSLRPTVVLPFGGSGASTWFELELAVNFGSSH